jgi:hypothetical protein
MIDKTASAHCEGLGKKGQGQTSTETGALADISLQATLEESTA